MRRRSTGGSIVLAFLLLILLGEILDMIGMIMPIIIIGIVTYFAIKMFSGNSTKKQKTTKKTQNTDTTKIDQEVKQYFSSNELFPLGNGIYLRVAKVERFDYLDVLMNGEVVCKLGEFKTFNAETYEAIRIQFEKGIGSVKQPTVIKEEKVEVVKQPTKSELENNIDTIQSYITVIDNKEIVSQLTTTASMLKNIDLIVKKTPAKESKIEKLNSFYLPTLITILKNYDFLCNTNKTDPDFNKVESKLISTIQLINEALNSILDSINDEEILDINSDMAVMESMLKQDGLVKKGTINEFKEGE